MMLKGAFTKSGKDQYSFERIDDPVVLQHEWIPPYKQIFPDVTDQESDLELHSRLIDPERNAFHVLRNHSGRVVGLNLVNFGPEAPSAMYCPYGGLMPELRNKNMYPMMTRISDQLMRENGCVYCIGDYEDPKRVPDYTDTPGEAAAMAEKRINFFRRALDVKYVDDPDLPYMRPASADPKEIQAYDILGVRALNNEWGPVLENLKDKGLKGPVFNHDDPARATAMSKDAYRLLYIEMNRLQYGDLDEKALKEQYPAIRKFLDAVDASPKVWVNLVSKAIEPKLTPNAAVDIHVVKRTLPLKG